MIGEAVSMLKVCKVKVIKGPKKKTFNINLEHRLGEVISVQASLKSDQYCRPMTPDDRASPRRQSFSQMS